MGDRQGDGILKEQERSIEEPDEPRMPCGSRSGWRVWVLVVGVFVVPGALYAAILAVPFLPLTTRQKLSFSSGLVVVAEGTCLLPAAVLGREVVTRYRRFLNPRYWFGEKPL